MSRWSNNRAFWALVFALGVGGTQIESLDDEVLHTDEHTFILMAGHVLGGNLPGVGLFDMKPPGLYYMLAGAFAIFGETLRVARLFGDFSVLMLCVSTFAVARRWIGPISSGAAGLAIVAATAGYTGQATLTDVPAIALFMGALWLLLARRRRPLSLAMAGFLASAAVLTRLNLAIPAVALGGWLLFAALFRPRWSAGWKPFLLFSAGGLLLPCLLLLLYWRADALLALRVVMIDAPLSYGGQMNVGETLVAWFEVLWGMAKNRPALSGLAALGAAVVGAASLATKERARNREQDAEPVSSIVDDRGHERQNVAASGRDAEPSSSVVDDQSATVAGPAEETLLACAFGAIVVCIAISGVAYHHYALLAIPIAAVYYARSVNWTFRKATSLSAPSTRRLRTTAALVSFAGATALFADGLRGWAQAPTDPWDRRFAAAAVAADRLPGDLVWSIDQPIVSWHLGLEPIHPLAYPQDLGKDAIMRPLVEAGYLAPDVLEETMNLNPAYLVVRSTDGNAFMPPGFVQKHDPGRAAKLGRWVQSRYSLFYDNGNVSVYKRNAAAGARP